MRCPVCSRHMVEITMQVDGKELLLRSCSNCDTKWWEKDGEQVELPGVLETASNR